jgi:hypothetical protein
MTAIGLEPTLHTKMSFEPTASTDSARRYRMDTIRIELITYVCKTYVLPIKLCIHPNKRIVHLTPPRITPTGIEPVTPRYERIIIPI